MIDYKEYGGNEYGATVIKTAFDLDCVYRCDNAMLRENSYSAFDKIHKANCLSYINTKIEDIISRTTPATSIVDDGGKLVSEFKTEMFIKDGEIIRQVVEKLVEALGYLDHYDYPTTIGCIEGALKLLKK